MGTWPRKAVNVFKAFVAADWFIFVAALGVAFLFYTRLGRGGGKGFESFATALVALFAAFTTFKLTFETYRLKRATEAQFAPYLTMHWGEESDDATGTLTITNHGLGPALAIKFKKILINGEDIQAGGMLDVCEVIGKDSSVTIPNAYTRHLAPKAPLRAIEIHAEYTDIGCLKHDARFVLGGGRSPAFIVREQTAGKTPFTG